MVKAALKLLTRPVKTVTVFTQEEALEEALR
jgi:hypothetical protein